MKDAPQHAALLPAGLSDMLQPEAEIEAASVERLMAVFAAHGYERIKPPMLEFEDTLLAGAGAAVAEQTFRIMDPDSHRMMGLRPDITPQVARIAATRLVGAPRPLRLSYAGQCLRVQGGQLSPARQVPEVGIELLGVDSPEADAEVVLVAAEALATLGLTRASFDLTLPLLANLLLDDGGIAGERRAALLHALDRKDAAAIGAHAGASAGMLIDLLLAAGAVEPALVALRRAPLPAVARRLANRLEATVGTLRQRAPALKLTVDPIEFRGFRYHTGVGIHVYAPGRHEELGRGGRYLAAEQEPATGLTLFPDALLRVAPKPAPMPRLYLPHGADHQAAAKLRADGFATIAGLAPHADERVEAQRLFCTHILHAGAARPLEE